MDFILKLFAFGYLTYFKLRRKTFHYDLFPVAAPEFENSIIPVVLGPLWINKGYLGLNECFIPKGNPSSKRFDPGSSLFQSWIGQYLIQSIRKQPDDPIKLFQSLSQCIISDQNWWLYIYTGKMGETLIDYNNVEFLGESLEQGLKVYKYEGQVNTQTDCSDSINLRFRIFRRLAITLINQYSNSHLKKEFITSCRGKSTEITLHGKIEIIRISDKKFAMRYEGRSYKLFN